MQIPKTTYVIAASTLALIALVSFQVKWLIDSQKLIEEQLNQKLQMALCSAVDNMQVRDASCGMTGPCCTSQDPSRGIFQLKTLEPVSQERIDSAVSAAFEFYDIELDYDISILDTQDPTKGCSLTPLMTSDNHLLSLKTHNKRSYILGKMKFMLLSSICILIFLTAVFVFANYSLLRQKQVNQINKDFFNNMAHEFRTPLTNISLASRLIARQQGLPPDHKYLKVIGSESHKLTEQIDRVLQLAKVENGEYQLEKQMVRPAHLIQQVIDGMDIQIREKNAEVYFRNLSDDFSLEADKFHLGNAFRNLLDNALKYAGDRPKIDISLQTNDKGVLIHFQDNGVGICPKDQSCIFDKYQRVQTGNVHNQKGFGLGLAYVKLIIERHKGFIKVFSDLNKGTRFDLFLPA